MKNESEKLREKPSQERELKLYRRKTERDDLIVISLGSGDDENVATSIDLDGVKVDIALISKSRRRERILSEATPALEEKDEE